MSEVKQSVNQLQIVGTLSEMNLEMKEKEVELKKDKKVTCKVIGKKEFKNPNLTVEVVRPDGSETLIGVTFNNGFDTNEKTLDKDGKIIDNKRFKALETIMGYTTKAKSTDENPATRVKINCSLNANEYVGQDGEFKSYPNINAFQCTSSGVPEEDIADGRISVIIRSIIDETVGEDTKETGRLKVEAYSFDYNKRAIPHSFFVEADLADDFRDFYERGDSCKLYYEVVSKHVGAKKQKSSGGFGRREEKITSGFTVTEYSIFKGDEKFEEENEYFISIKDMKTAMEDREIMIENMKEKAKEKGSKPSVKKEEKKGLGSRPSKADFKDIENSDGMPF